MREANDNDNPLQPTTSAENVSFGENKHMSHNDVSTKPRQASFPRGDAAD